MTYRQLKQICRRKLHCVLCQLHSRYECLVTLHDGTVASPAGIPDDAVDILDKEVPEHGQADDLQES